jgi:predicted neuraminidase
MRGIFLFIVLWTMSSVSYAGLTTNNISLDTIKESQLFDEPEVVSHGSTVLPISDGTVLLCWYGGTAEAHKDGHIYCRKKINGKWGERKVAVKPKEQPANSILKNAKLANSTLIEGQDGIIYLIYSAVPVSGGFSNARVDYKSSKDKGTTWSESRRLDFNIGTMVKNKVLHMGDDQYMLPLYDELSLFTPGFKNYSYTQRLLIKDGEIKVLKRVQLPGGDNIQPALALCGSNGRVCAYMRNKNYGKTFFAEYNWQKETWSERTLIDVPNSNSPVDVITLSDGRILMVYNNSATRPRAPLSLAISSDGTTFKHLLDIEADITTDFHYPCMQKDKSGSIHISYTYDGRKGIKYVRLLESEILKIAGKKLN